MTETLIEINTVWRSPIKFNIERKWKQDFIHKTAIIVKSTALNAFQSPWKLFSVKIISKHWRSWQWPCNLRWWQFNILAYQVFSSATFQGQKVGAKIPFFLKHQKESSTNILRCLFKSIFSVSWFHTQEIDFCEQKGNFLAQCRASDAIILILQIKNSHNSCSKVYSFKDIFLLFLRRIATNFAWQTFNKFNNFSWRFRVAAWHSIVNSSTLCCTSCNSMHFWHFSQVQPQVVKT